MRAISLIMTFLMASSILLPLTTASENTEARSQTIDTDEIWDTEQNLNQDLIIGTNGKLTIDSKITIASGTTITVDEGGELILNGELVSAEPTSATYMEVYNNTFIQPYFEGLIDSGTLRVNFASTLMANDTVDLNVNGNNKTWDGSDSLEFNVAFDDQLVNITFYTFCQFCPLIESVEAFDSNGVIYKLHADEWNHSNGVLKTETSDAAFNLIVNGELSSSNGNFSGAAISCHGICVFENSSLSWSAPLDIYGSLTIKTSNINGSRTYEDIIVHDTAIIDYEVNTMLGTGGPTDKWIRLLSQRVITTNLKDAPGTVHYEGLGYLGYDGDLLLDSNGMIDLGVSTNPQTSKFLRMTEWVDSLGETHQENGMIIITLKGGTSVWNDDYSITLDPAPTSPNHSTTVPLPNVVVDSVVPEDSIGIANKGLGIMVTVTNSGSVAVSTNIQCFEGSELADITTLYVSLQPGETKDIPGTWYANSSGAKSINCKALIPVFFNTLSEDLAQSVGTESDQVSFKEPEDSEDLPLILYSVIIIVFVVATIVFTRFSANKYTSEREEKQYDLDNNYDLDSASTETQNSD